jgi:hypothetical protein
LLATTGGVGYLTREAYRHFFPGRPTVVEQLKVLDKLVETCGKSNAKCLKVRISTDAKSNWEMPPPIQQAKVVREDAGTIDLEITFT